MAKRKVRPHPGALAELLKSKGITLTDAARDSSRGTRVIDRKTLAKIDRGDEVKLETLQKLANNLKVPITYFDPPAGNSVDQQVNSQPKDPEWLSLLLHKVDADDIVSMLWRLWGLDRNIEWKLNVDRVDDEAISLLEQFEDAVNEFYDYVTVGPVSGGLRAELDRLKKTKHLTTLMEQLAKHNLAVLGALYLSWGSKDDIDTETGCEFITYSSHEHIMLSIEGHPAHERREKVWLGTVPPRFAPSGTFVRVNGKMLEMDPFEMAKRRLNEIEPRPLAQWVLDRQNDEAGRFRVEEEQKDSDSEASSGGSNVK
jgi:transcriptional regulator with XRE-family HTH domain